MFSMTYFISDAEIYLQDVDSFESECAEVIKPSWTVEKLDNVPFGKFLFSMFWATYIELIGVHNTNSVPGAHLGKL